MRIDVVSDLHFDFYNIDALGFVREILPKNQSDVLLIAGDLGHHNEQNAEVLRVLREIGGYSHILVVIGNHDLYIPPRAFANSWERLAEMQAMIVGIPGVRILDGDVVEIGGVRFGGAPMWYDLSFGRGLGLSTEALLDLWRRTNNDANFILWGAKPMDAFLEEQRQRLRAIVDKVDVMLTHVGPDWRQAEGRYLQDPTTAFFFFDGQEELERFRGTWVFGHTHARSEATIGGCRLLNAALGYPWEIGDRRIVTTEVEPRDQRSA